VVECCERGNEHWPSIIGEFFDWIGNHYLLKNDLSHRSYNA
jgi:hypothetical protein